MDRKGRWIGWLASLAMLVGVAPTLVADRLVGMDASGSLPDLLGSSAGQERSDGIGIKLCWIPPGSFDQGNPVSMVGVKGADVPVRRVTIPRGFWMGKFEVTQGEYRLVMGKDASETPTSDRHPADQVVWEDATAFCEQLGSREQEAGRLPPGWRYRLPSESEWEYAARAGSTGAHHGELDGIAWYNQNSQSQVHPVGGKLANAWGLHDVLGNVWEWCQDPWHADYEGAPTDGSAWVTDVEGVEVDRRVLRGGSWLNLGSFTRLSIRSRGVIGTRIRLNGFRVVVAQDP